MIKLNVLKGSVLGVNVYRGFAPLSLLSKLSKADIYDAETNPTGTQRDLSPKHARDAYEYIRNHDFGYWPEVFLCARDPKIIKFESLHGSSDFGILQIDERKILRSSLVLISRVDGNHRLHYGDGREEGFEPISKTVSFCLADNVTLLQEIVLFRDINNNQRKMNTSHLDKIEVRLSGDERLRTANPSLFIAQKLAHDESSPFYKLVYEGGRKPAGAFIPLRTLRTGIEYMFSRPTKLNAGRNVDAQYILIRNFFRALRDFIPGAWTEYKRYIVLRGAGLWGMCFIGAEVIDRVLSQGKFNPDDMLAVLRSGKDWDWTNTGDFQGFSGRGGALRIRDQVVVEFAHEGTVSVKSLFQKIIGQG